MRHLQAHLQSAWPPQVPFLFFCTLYLFTSLAIVGIYPPRFAFLSCLALFCIAVVIHYLQLNVLISKASLSFVILEVLIHSLSNIAKL